jgi:uncharacterized protein YndB with AHSA1/START domain
LHIEQTQVVKAPREQVFQAWTDYEAVPKWQTLFTRVTVTKRVGNTVGLDLEVNMRGRKAMRTEKHVLTPPERVDVEGEMEGITNTTVWKFEPIPEGTRVTAVVEARLPLRLKVIGPLVKRQFQAIVREWLQDLAKYVEAK